ncbi:RnfABCDGE type electron transport complex subunit D [Vibrio mangrovi]|uniref:Ion-translocating oxidoreductase complex subunit D n=1 Tax=Vibrio mangrovi TaxID=474394 RepID=A0A1Y6IQB0_9VIBR|nr:RnfABCDGE type electron transport complex subunit D [Vibrio mangrovi]MDW6003955.1 RnfABCDGE type electron transport complex subunit D [Vibrio mangrovi]SMR99251.1 Electron transport complex protein RnfD [Vibrio mangrovi]
MIQYEAVAGPFGHSANSSTRIMYTVILTLLPACLFGVLQFGLHGLYVLLSSCIAAVMAEWFCLLLMKKRLLACMDGSAILTGLLLAMSLPPAFPLTLTVFGSVFAVVLGKQIYGGLGQNLFNPAMLARVMLLICFPVEMTQWIDPTPIDFSHNQVTVPATWLHFDGMSSATALSPENHTALPWMDLALGNQSGSLGETCALLILCGGLYLLYRRIIHWAIPVTFFIGLGVPALLAHLFNPEHYLPFWTQWTSGGAILGAFYIATDLVTSPTSIRGQILYGLGCGFLVWLIRTFGSYPEGVAFAVLLMNAASPVIDYYLRPNIFGSNNASAREK